MIIINADDFGRTPGETDAALACYQAGGLTSATAMVFMEDTSRAAGLVQQSGLGLGLHLNLHEPFTAPVPAALAEAHGRVGRFLRSHKYALLLYDPRLRQQFELVVRAQLDEFIRVFGRQPSHIDGHQHKHLCTNVLIDQLLPKGYAVRRSFSFLPGEKSPLNRAYRRLVDRSLAKRHRLTDFFFSLQQCLQYGRLERVFELSKGAVVELMAHPVHQNEYGYLMSDRHRAALQLVERGTYKSV